MAAEGRPGARSATIQSYIVCIGHRIYPAFLINRLFLNEFPAIFEFFVFCKSVLFLENQKVYFFYVFFSKDFYFSICCKIAGFVFQNMRHYTFGSFPNIPLISRYIFYNHILQSYHSSNCCICLRTATEDLQEAPLELQSYSSIIFYTILLLDLSQNAVIESKKRNFF